LDGKNQMLETELPTHITWELKILDHKKYINLSDHINEIGKMLGATTLEVK